MGTIDNSRVKIEIDGIEFSAKRGAKIIEVADEAGIYIPRFCYHKKLSIAANCRMCLVEVEKAPKLFPACATPIAEGMKIFTNTDKVIAAQRAVMEFLLINHPLDCPICDQGGECELQDLTVGYGCTTSRFLESKRAFDDYDLGPLVSTDVTRCILCSRCVRFCSEISGTDDLGIINRGSNSRIFTFLKEHLNSGLSGNVVDLCPVGSLTAKPSKFKVRPWELIQKSFVSYHDCVGSNLYVHVAKDKVIRVVPKRNDFLNETWISDRDRFSYEGLYSSDRLNLPMLKKNGEWCVVSWEDAFCFVFDKIKNIINNFGINEICALASHNSTCEEFYVLQKFLRTLGSNNIEHRLNQVDFSYQEHMPIFTGVDIGLDEFDKLDAVFIIGCDIIKDHPIIGIKLRKILNNGGNVFVLNPIDFNFFMNISEKIIVNPKNFIHVIASLIKNMCFFNKDFYDNDLFNVLSNLKDYEKYKKISEKFFNFKRKLILIGSYVCHGPDYSKILALCNFLSKISNSFLGVLTDGANSSGAWLTGFVPHRLPGGKNSEFNDLESILFKFFKMYILFGIEVEYNSSYSKKIIESLNEAECVVSFSSFKSDMLLKISDVILPITSSYENSGTFINMSGVWQSFESVVAADYEVKFGWKAICDLANFFKIPGFSYNDLSSILMEFKSFVDDNCSLNWNFFKISDLDTSINNEFTVIPFFSQYNSDSLVRRASSLQKIYKNIDDNNTVIKFNELTYNKVNMFLNKNLIYHIDNSIPDHVIFIRNYNKSNQIGIHRLYDSFVFDRV